LVDDGTQYPWVRLYGSAQEEEEEKNVYYMAERKNAEMRKK
jgi:hypothetical protein